MILFKQASALEAHLDKLRRQGESIGFVPTMGALHAGHLSLLKAAGKENGTVVCSIFVNPTQFNDPSDFEKYPVTIEKDTELLHQAGCSILFLPSVEEIYPNGTNHLPKYDIGFLETLLEGAYRPGHFQGVCQVMHRLLDIVSADNLYMGQKDYQQCMVIQRLLDRTGISTRLHTCPTLREPDGLAMSSRNTRLSADARQTALQLSRELRRIVEEIKPGDCSSLRNRAKQNLEASGFTVDYVSIADAETLQPVSNWDGNRPLVTLVAAFIGGVRLIDNMLIPVRK